MCLRPKVVFRTVCKSYNLHPGCCSCCGCHYEFRCQLQNMLQVATECKLSVVTAAPMGATHLLTRWLVVCLCGHNVWWSHSQTGYINMGWGCLSFVILVSKVPARWQLADGAGCGCAWWSVQLSGLSWDHRSCLSTDCVLEALVPNSPPWFSGGFWFGCYWFCHVQCCCRVKMPCTYGVVLVILLFCLSTRTAQIFPAVLCKTCSMLKNY